MDYRVSFSIHLLEDKAPKNWPNPVIHDAYIRAFNFTELKDLVDRHVLSFVRQSGFVTIRDSNKPLGDDITTLDLRTFVPFHMIAFVTHQIQPLSGEIPDGSIDENLLLM